ncbi:unnamed protein product [Arctia plantaginis]|uniref:Amino acid transporter transmembrane domain-containing protein n=1 Tax=Arctia plantaginis TaxID=874455 RepID=A0A8S1BK25_ARCPL|nr:unnamed protein product [Arctia plantaginis]
MFVYEYMSGLVESVRGDSNEPFDPYKFRKVAHPTTYMETMIHLLKGSIGAGILAMPDACRRVGIIIAIIGIIFIGGFATYCLQLMIYSEVEVCRRHRRGYMAYSKCMKLAILEGPKWFRCSSGFFYFLVEFMLILWQLGVCSIYFVFVAQNLKQVFDYYGMTISLRLMITYLLPMEIVVNLVKNLKLLTPMSTFSNAVTLAGMGLIMFYLIEDDLEYDDSKLQLKELTDIPQFIGTTLFAMEAVGVVLALEYNMENPRRFVGLCGLLSIGMIIILSLFVLMGVPGYFKYGDETKASITLNLPQEQKKAQAAKVAFSLALFFSFPLQNFVAYELIWRKLKKRSPSLATKGSDYLLRIALVLVPYAPAVSIPKLGPFISLMGALCLSLLAIVFPGIMDMCLWYPNNYGAAKYKLLRDIFIIFFGLICLFSGVYVSILEFIND